jgi:hypothetical protein
MRRTVVLGAAVVWTLGCAAAVRWEKTGASDADRRRDEAECVSLASREGTVSTAPTASASTATPLESQRTRIQSYDTALVEQCMTGRGYHMLAPARPPG